MKLMIYAELQETTLQQNLGKADYSYFLVAKIFAPMLQKFGDVIFVDTPQQADAIFADAQQQQEPCLLLCFTPPHRAPLQLRCPAACVFAWEYADLPTEMWDDDPRTDWRNVLRAQGRAICHSTYSADVVRKAMGPDFPVYAIPAPVYEKFSARQKMLGDSLFATRTLSLRGNVVDSCNYRPIVDDVGGDCFSFVPEAGQLALAPWDRQTTTLNFAHRQPGSGLLDGFYISEPWGTWSRASSPGIFLPFLLTGKCQLQLLLAAYGANVGREIFLHAGNQKIAFRPTGEFALHEFVIDAAQPIRQIRFSGIDTRTPRRSADPRSLGIGVCSLDIENLDDTVTAPSSPPPPIKEKEITATTVTLQGVVYTSVMNPDDGRKNFDDIVTAFCHALRDAEDATLVIKAVHHSIASYLGTVNYLLQSIGPTRCRVLVLHGYLDDADYRQLIDASTYYVNASRCEGGCLPLVEFMSTGTPAIAPDNTAMRDYVAPDSTFIVESAPVATNWPHDPRLGLRTSYYRIEWESLSQQFRNSYELVKKDPASWHAMGQRAAAGVRRFYGGDVVEASLRRFLQEAGLDAAVAGAQL